MENVRCAIYVGFLTAMSAAGETPSFENDYGRTEIGHPWGTMLVGEGLDGWQASEAPFTPSVWRREGDAIIADTGQGQPRTARPGRRDVVCLRIQGAGYDREVGGSTTRIRYLRRRHFVAHPDVPGWLEDDGHPPPKRGDG